MGERTLTDSQIEDIAEYVEFKCNKLNRAVSVEEIQDMVENQIMMNQHAFTNLPVIM